MKFGVRQIVNVVFKAKNTQTIGPYTFAKGQPVFYMDSAKTSTLEGAATTVYATGGRGNTRLISWEGEKTLTFTVEDALLSPISFAMLSGAGLIKPAQNSTDKVHFHQTTRATSAATGAIAATNNKLEIDLTDALESTETICSTAPIYIMKLDSYGDLTGEVLTGWSVTGGTGADAGKKLEITGLTQTIAKDSIGAVMVDYYVIKDGKNISEMQIDAGHFAGYYYVEADTLFRRQEDGKDLPANITFPNVKIQSNFTFSMASTGDPSTFTFTMDALPGYTYFNKSKQVLCAIQVVDDATETAETSGTLFPHPTGFDIEESHPYDAANNHLTGDSVAGQYTGTGTETDDWPAGS